MYMYMSLKDALVMFLQRFLRFWGRFISKRLFFVCKGNDYITIFFTHCIGAVEFFSLDREVETNYCATGN